MMLASTNCGIWWRMPSCGSSNDATSPLATPSAAKNPFGKHVSQKFAVWFGKDGGADELRSGAGGAVRELLALPFDTPSRVERLEGFAVS